MSPDEQQAESEHRSFMLTAERALSRRRHIARAAIIIYFVTFLAAGFVTCSCPGFFAVKITGFTLATCFYLLGLSMCIVAFSSLLPIQSILVRRLLSIPGILLAGFGVIYRPAMQQPRDATTVLIFQALGY